MNYLEEIQSGKLTLDAVPYRFRTSAVCRAAIRLHGDHLRYVPKRLRSKTICLEAVHQCGHALMHVQKDLRTSEICVAALLKNADALYYVPPGTDLGAIRPEAEEAADWERVKDAIRQYGVDMGFWHNGECVWDPNSEGTCGTRHCIAGWVQALSKDPKIRRMRTIEAGVRLLPRHSHLFFKTELTKAQILSIP